MSAGRWDEESILDAIGRWVEAFGAPPAEIDWHPANAARRGHHARAERFRLGNWPTSQTVRRVLGCSFGEAVRRAGFRPRASTWNRAELDTAIGQAATLAPGPQMLASPLKAVNDARLAGDDRELDQALLGLAATALAWRERIPPG